MKNLSFIVVLLVFGVAGCASSSKDKTALERIPFLSNWFAPTDLEAIYMARFEALNGPSGGVGLSSYSPLKPVAGAQNWSAIPNRALTERRISEDALAKAQSYAAENNSSAFMVWQDGALEAEAYFGDFKKDSLIVSKSLAKPLSTIAVGRALALGHIESLDQSVADFIKEWQGTPKEKILVRHLLGMRTGLLPQAMAHEPENILNRAYLHPAHDEIIIRDYPLVGEPGARYDYSNANSELVAPLIERATGIPYEDWLTREVFRPLGALGGEIWMNRDGGTPHSGCCILLPAETYLRLAILLIDDGVWNGNRLLPEGFVEEMKTPTPQNPHVGMSVYVGSPYIERRGIANPEIQFGKTLHSEPYMAEDLFLFDGNSNQVVFIVPSARLIVLRTGAPPPKEPEWDNAILPNILLRDLNK